MTSRGKIFEYESLVKKLDRLKLVIEVVGLLLFYLFLFLAGFLSSIYGFVYIIYHIIIAGVSLVILIVLGFNLMRFLKGNKWGDVK